MTKKVACALAISFMIILHANGMKRARHEIALFPEAPPRYLLGSLFGTEPRIQFTLASIAHEEADTASRDGGFLLEEINARFQIARKYLVQALAANEMLQQKDSIDLHGRLTPEERALIQYWLANIPLESALHSDSPSIFRLGSVLADYAETQFQLASIAHREITVAKATRRPPRELTALYQILRWHAIRAINSKFLSTPQIPLAPRDENWAKLWLAELFAQGLGGERDVVQAKALSEDLLKDSSPYSLKREARDLLKKLDDK